MSGFSEAAPNRNKLDESLKKLHQLNELGFKEVLTIYQTIYGHKKKEPTEITSKVEAHLKQFWENEIEALEEKKRDLIESIEQHGKKAVDLEKALGLAPAVIAVQSDGPLVEIKERIWNLLSHYEELKNNRMTEFYTLKNKEEELCGILDEKPKISELEKIFDSIVPTCELMDTCKDRLVQLEQLKAELEYSFESYKEELKTLLEECEVVAFNLAERFAVSFGSEGEEINFPVNKRNLEKLQTKTEQYREMKQHMINEADHLRQEILKISRKMMKDPKHIETLVSQYSGFNKQVINQLKDELKKLKEERQRTLKELVLSHRTLLDEWWTKCCYSDFQRAKFMGYNVTHYSEEVLELHEIELEMLQNLYNENKRIFHLAEKHQEQWNRLLHLEDQATKVDRLFNNRGGKLLQEERERKTIQKKLPAIKAELVTLLNEYKARNRTDFLYFGTPLILTLEEMEEERMAVKENKKLQRKAANVENVLLESKLGSRPLTGNKRRMQSPHQPSSSTKVMKMASCASSSTASTNSCKSTASSEYGYRVTRGDTHTPASHRLRSPGPARSGAVYLTVHTPVNKPAASTPENEAH